MRGILRFRSISVASPAHGTSAPEHSFELRPRTNQAHFFSNSARQQAYLLCIERTNTCTRIFQQLEGSTIPSSVPSMYGVQGVPATGAAIKLEQESSVTRLSYQHFGIKLQTCFVNKKEFSKFIVYPWQHAGREHRSHARL